MSPGLQLWIGAESQLDDAAIRERCVALMSDEERERDRRFLVEGARRLHRLARAMQRTVLASCLPGVSPRELRFVTGASGRPSLAPPFDASGVEFNLAHTRGLVALAVARDMRLGVDVEDVHKKVPLSAARRYFSAAEVQSLDALPEEAKPRHFLRLWTLKEAYLKAIGKGLAGGLGSMTFRLGDMGHCEFERALDPEAARWWFGQFEVGADHLLAVACLADAKPPAVEWHEFTA